MREGGREGGRGREREREREREKGRVMGCRDTCTQKCTTVLSGTVVLLQSNPGCRSHTLNIPLVSVQQ